MPTISRMRPEIPLTHPKARLRVFSGSALVSPPAETVVVCPPVVLEVVGVGMLSRLPAWIEKPRLIERRLQDQENTEAKDWLSKTELLRDEGDVADSREEDQSKQARVIRDYMYQRLVKILEMSLLGLSTMSCQVAPMNI
jgi:hypothetical protein